MTPSTATDVKALADGAIEYARTLRRPPESTYRLQLHKDFTFKHATAIVPYLAGLGITHVYCSSYLRAAPGSTHGYDVIDHTRLNPEIGSDEDYRAFNAALKQHNLAHILDTVPNHVGVATNENQWWNDVLENGRDSAHGGYFDVAWDQSARPELNGKILLPGLGKQYGESLQSGELQLSFNPAVGGLFVKFYDHLFPIAPRTYSTVLCTAAEKLSPADKRAVQTILEFADRATATDAASVKQQLADLCRGSAAIGKALEQAAGNFAKDPDQLHGLLEKQHYRLASWRVGPDEINYRRFFAINDLAALQMERQDVFEAAHSFILPRLADGTIAGLRIDHPDGLSDPLQYFRRLQAYFLLACAKQKFSGDAAAWQSVRGTLLAELEQRVEEGTYAPPPLYVVIEKILALGEPLPQIWPVDGTSGYDFLDMVNGLFVNASAEEAMDKTYHDLIGDQPSYDEVVIQNKKIVLRQLLPSELARLARMLDRIGQRNRDTRDFTTSGLAAALTEVIAAFPLYRTYITGPEISDADKAALHSAIEKAVERNPTVGRQIYDFIESTLLQKSFPGATSEDRAAARTFARRFQQLTAPATAKGIEDTTFYQYQRLISLNEVGGEPSKFGISNDELHAYFADRAKKYPYALSTLSTHDTKRSEDVRARISVLADVPEQWREVVSGWFEANGKFRGQTGGLPSPAPDEEYMIYQGLLGAWPVELEGGAADEAFAERFHAFVLKSIREANVRTTWTAPSEPHESAVKKFVSAVLDPKQSPDFHKTFGPFQQKIAHFGRLASLSQTLLKLTAPGAADTYQGTEMWDLSLVDPDNRRPVDYGVRQQALKAVVSEDADSLFAETKDARAKILLHQRVLELRKKHAGLFTAGEYQPLNATGGAAEHVFAFSRTHNGVTAVVAVAKNLAKLTGFDPAKKLDGALWQNTALPLPVGKTWHDALSGKSVPTSGSSPLADLFAGRPVVLLISE